MFRGADTACMTVNLSRSWHEQFPHLAEGVWGDDQKIFFLSDSGKGKKTVFGSPPLNPLLQGGEVGPCRPLV